MELHHQEYRKRSPFLTFLKYFGFGVLGTIGVAAFGFLFGYFVMLLWNWLMPEIFGLGLITFWQAFGLVVLGRMLFGRLSPPWHRKPDNRYRNHPYHHHGCCGDKKTEWKKWRHYGNYWKEEGERSFNEYVRKKDESGEAEPA
jgi:hypothetical protein